MVYKSLYFFYFSFFLMCVSANISADVSTQEIALIRHNSMNSAVTLSTVGDLPRKTVDEYLSLLNPNGSFSDTNSTIEVMTGRLLFLAQAFQNDPAWKGNIHLKTNLYSATQFWLDNDPGNSGWPNGAFEEPRAMVSIGLCLYDAIQSDKTNSPEMAAQLDTLLNGIIEWANAVWTVHITGGGFEGANVAYRLFAMIGQAAIADDPQRFNNITNGIAKTFIVGGNDIFYTGRHSDESWHQHNGGGGQSYWLGYGKDWLNRTRDAGVKMKNTRWALNNTQLNIFADCIIDGWQWFYYRDQGVYSVGGRHSLIKNALIDNDYISKQIDYLRNLAGENNLIRNSELETVKIRMDRPYTWWPSFNASKYFKASDLMICGKENYYVAVKMLSNRTAGPESGNGAGKKNYCFGEGSTIILNSAKEYVNARIGWNYRAIPGTTVEQKSGSLPLVEWGVNGNSDNEFAGGISDGHYAACAFKLNRAYSYSTVTANKSYFFFNNEFIALGSKINKHPPYPGDEVWTTIDQPEREADITYFLDGKLNTIPLAESVQTNFNNIKNGAWFHHGNKGYIIFPDNDGVNIKLWAENRSGDWHDLDDRYNPGDMQTVNIFQLSVNHEINPQNKKYAYLVNPNIELEDMSNYWENIPMAILENSEEIQAVKNNSNLAQLVFYSPGEIAVDNNLTVSVDRAAVVMLSKNLDTLQITLADPNQKETQIVMNVSAELSCETNIFLDLANNTTEIIFDLPQGLFRGKSVTYNFEIIPEPFTFFNFLFFLLYYAKNRN